MEVDYISVRFKDNHSKRWDGKEVEVPGKTVVRLGEWTAEGLERGQVHWPGKGGKSRGKIWKCVVLAPVTSDLEADDVTVPTTSRPSRGKYTLVEGMETIMPGTCTNYYV